VFNCEYCNLYSGSNRQALSQHRSRCLKNPSVVIENKSEWYCKLCNENFGSRRIMRAHNKAMGHKPSHFIENIQRGTYTCDFCEKVFETSLSGFSTHRNFCHVNPDKKTISRQPMSEATKSNLSEKMKELHAKGIASRWKNPHLHESYAESFFSKVINNEFEDKSVTRELPVGKYFIDFAWEGKKKAIEIDGQQHERYKHQQESDARKDAFLKEEGWEVMRILFKDMYNNPKHYIKLAKEFIDSV
jgi:very-short-patch-repair endonuclease